VRVTRLLPELAVADLETALGWYALLLGRRADARPMGGLAEWRYEGGDLQLFEDADRAGRGLLTVFVEDVEAELARLASLGITPGVRGEATSLGVEFATITDPDGNAITLVHQP